MDLGGMRSVVADVLHSTNTTRRGRTRYQWTIENDDSIKGNTMPLSNPRRRIKELKRKKNSNVDDKEEAEEDQTLLSSAKKRSVKILTRKNDRDQEDTADKSDLDDNSTDQDDTADKSDLDDISIDQEDTADKSDLDDISVDQEDTADKSDSDDNSINQEDTADKSDLDDNSTDQDDTADKSDSDDNSIDDQLPLSNSMKRVKEFKRKNDSNEDDTNESEGPGDNKKGLKLERFCNLEGIVTPEILQAVSDMKFDKMTQVQSRCMLPLLEGRDVVVTAKTGSGKTLAFLIPALELLNRLKFKSKNGTGVIILSPTRELATQTFAVLSSLLRYLQFTKCLLIGGSKLKLDIDKLEIGCNIIVATPGRLVDHLLHTPNFVTKNLKCLILDEADKILEIGFEQELRHIIRLLPKRRQTLFFSATTRDRLKNILKEALNSNPIFIKVEDEGTSVATVLGLRQGYVVCPLDKRFNLLFTFLKKNKNKKIMVFFSTCLSVKFHEQLCSYIQLDVYSIHGQQQMSNRIKTFMKFCADEKGTLLCTNVAARGLDIPNVDWIFQYDTPDTTEAYIHRVGRTARGDKQNGNALLLLLPEEIGFLRYLKLSKVPLNEYTFDWKEISNIQSSLQEIVTTNTYLFQSAKAAFKSFVNAYAQYNNKEVFNIKKISMLELAKSFGFSTIPIHLSSHLNAEVESEE